MQALWLEGESQAASKPQLSKPAGLQPRHAFKFLMGTSKARSCFQASTLRPLCYIFTIQETQEELGVVPE